MALDIDRIREYSEDPSIPDITDEQAAFIARMVTATDARRDEHASLDTDRIRRLAAESDTVPPMTAEQVNGIASLLAPDRVSPAAPRSQAPRTCTPTVGALREAPTSGAGSAGDRLLDREGPPPMDCFSMAFAAIANVNPEDLDDDQKIAYAQAAALLSISQQLSAIHRDGVAVDVPTPEVER